jgi:hypothetical protein
METAATKLLAENAVLLQEIFDDSVPLAVHPAGEHQHQEVQRIGWGGRGHGPRFAANRHQDKGTEDLDPGGPSPLT